MRVDKYLAAVTDYSRADAKRLLKASRVSVDAVIITDPRTDIAPTATVSIDGEGSILSTNFVNTSSDNSSLFGPILFILLLQLYVSHVTNFAVFHVGEN